MLDLQLLHCLIALELLTCVPRDREFVFCLLREEHSPPLPDRAGNPWKLWGESFSKCRAEQTAWEDLVECVCLQVRDEEGQDCWACR